VITGFLTAAEAVCGVARHEEDTQCVVETSLEACPAHDGRWW
jgi:hypothetical protein